MSQILPFLMVILSPVLGSSLTHAENGKNFSPSSIYGVTVPRDTKAEEALLVGKSSSSTVAEQPGDTDANDQEEVWVEISDAIEGLNDVVGDRMFLDLRRKNESEMEVRLDAGFWERVRYQTRVDLKNDISNIWHLYVRQYYDGGFSSVRFVDDETDKTIDIFSQAK